MNLSKDIRIVFKWRNWKMIKEIIGITAGFISVFFFIGIVIHEFGKYMDDVSYKNEEVTSEEDVL